MLTPVRGAVTCGPGRNGVGKTSLLRAIAGRDPVKRGRIVWEDKDIGHVIRLLVNRGDMAIVLVEQYFDFAKELADTYAVMDRGEVVASGRGDDMEEADVRGRIAV